MTKKRAHRPGQRRSRRRCRVIFPAGGPELNAATARELSGLLAASIDPTEAGTA